MRRCERLERLPVVPARFILLGAAAPVPLHPSAQSGFLAEFPRHAYERLGWLSLHPANPEDLVSSSSVLLNISACALSMAIFFSLKQRLRVLHFFLLLPPPSTHQLNTRPR